ncbi:MAG: dienelactone hydrolase family protein [Hyphomicrobiaceae bacterium]
MTGRDIKIQASEGGEFDAYIAERSGAGKAPAIVLASSVHGVTADQRAIADSLASEGYIAIVPDLFWRTMPGPLAIDDPRTKIRSQPRKEKIRTGEADLRDTLAAVRRLDRCNGWSAVIGFCYGGPYAVIGPKRLGFDAGVSCHGTNMLDYIGELEGLEKPVSINVGDEDHAAPKEVLDAYQAAAKRMPNVDMRIYPGARHGYMFAGNAKAYDPGAYDATMQRVLKLMAGLKS